MTSATVTSAMMLLNLMFAPFLLGLAFYRPSLPCCASHKSQLVSQWSSCFFTAELVGTCPDQCPEPRP